MFEHVISLTHRPNADPLLRIGPSVAILTFGTCVECTRPPRYLCRRPRANTTNLAFPMGDCLSPDSSGFFDQHVSLRKSFAGWKVSPEYRYDRRGGLVPHHASPTNFADALTEARL